MTTTERRSRMDLEGCGEGSPSMENRKVLGPPAGCNNPEMR